MDTTRIDSAAAVARLVGAALSFLYMILAVPHLDGFAPAKLSSPWYAAALLVALIWLPLLWLHVRMSGKRLSAVELAASFGPMVLLGGFFGLLFALA